MKNKKHTPTPTKKANQHTHIGWKPWMEALLFALFAAWMLVGMNSDYLFAVQEHSLFLSNSQFFYELMAIPNGLMQWIGCYLTQFFYYPAIGACLLILIWLATYALTIKAFRLPKAWSHLAWIPVAALLCSTIDLGYWMYQIKIPGYWFSESLSLMLVMLGVWAGRGMKGYWRYLYLGVWIAAGYPFMGWYALFGALLTSIVYAIKDKKCGTKWYALPAFAVGMAGIVPLLWYYHYTQVRLEDAWIYGFPRFELKDGLSWVMTVPFLVSTAACLAFALSGIWGHKAKEKWIVPMRAIVLVLCAAGVWAGNFDDHNFHAELRMYRHTEACDWRKVLEEVENSAHTPTRQMVMMKNIALINTGEIGNRMFHYNNGGKLPHKRDNIMIHLAHTAGPLLYYCHGKMNFATRWAIENGVEYGFDVSGLKILARCALVSGEYDVARKYIHQLSQTTFHKDEAEWLDTFCQNPEKIAKEEKFKTAKELYTHLNEDLDSDNGLCEMYLLHNFSRTMNIDSRLLQEMTLDYALISKDIQLFWPRFFQYATLHQGEEMPIHYQEAAYMYGNLERPPFDISKMPFDQKKIKNRYTQFNSTIQYNLKRGIKEEEIANILKPAFGNTFWWFYFFCNNVGSY